MGIRLGDVVGGVRVSGWCSSLEWKLLLLPLLGCLFERYQLACGHRYWQTCLCVSRCMFVESCKWVSIRPSLCSDPRTLPLLLIVASVFLGLWIYFVDRTPVSLLSLHNAVILTLSTPARQTILIAPATGFADSATASLQSCHVVQVASDVGYRLRSSLLVQTWRGR